MSRRGANWLVVLAVICGMSGACCARQWVVSQNHPAATDAGPGTADRPFRTITAAALVAEPGDTVRVHEGIYRERVAPVRAGRPDEPITYQAQPDQRVIIKATDLWQPDWQPVPEHPGLWFGRFADDQFDLDQRYAAGWEQFPRKYNPYTIKLRSGGSYLGGGTVDPFGNEIAADQAAGHLTVGQLFVDGRPLRQVASPDRVRLLEGTWTVASDARGLYVRFPRHVVDPARATVELATRPRCFAPYKRRTIHHIHVRGFVMEGGASNFHEVFYAKGPPQVGVIGTRGAQHWVIENNTIRFGKSLGIDVGTEGDLDSDGLDQPERGWAGHHLIRNNIIADNGAGGIQGIRSGYTRIIGNVIERNNRLGFTAPEIGAIKLHFFKGGVIEGNLIRDNDCYGVWLDNMWHDARITRNAILSNQGAGIFMEMGFGPMMIDNNIIALTRGSTQVSGDGIYAHDASNITVAHNLIFHNANFGVWTHIGTGRRAGVWKDGRHIEHRRCESSGWNVVNNIIVGNHGGAVGLPAEHTRSRDNHADYNLYAASYNRWTLETYADSLDWPIFMLNDNKGIVKRADIAAQFQRKLDEADLPPDQRPGMARWIELPYLRLEEWRLLSGHDKHSAFAVVMRTMAATRTPYVTFTIDTSPKRIGCRKIDGVDRDYFGNAIADEPLPGPFQKLKMIPALDNRPRQTVGRGPFNHIATDQCNHLILWPRPAEPQD
jgi:hypothetical protein